MSRSKAGLATLVLLAWFGAGTAAVAQGVVPGGWSSQFSFQTFAAPGAVAFGGGGYGGYGYGGQAAGFSPYAYDNGGYATYRPATRASSYNAFTPLPQTATAVDPLIGVIRRSTGRKGSR